MVGWVDAKGRRVAVGGKVFILSMMGRWMQVQAAMAGKIHVLGCNWELTVSLGSRDGLKMYRGGYKTKWILGDLDLLSITHPLDRIGGAR